MLVLAKGFLLVALGLASYFGIIFGGPAVSRASWNIARDVLQCVVSRFSYETLITPPMPRILNDLFFVTYNGIVVGAFLLYGVVLCLGIYFVIDLWRANK